MRTFSATVFDAAGIEHVLRLQSDTEERIRGFLHEQGYTIQALVEQHRQHWWSKLQGIEVGRKIKPQDRIRFLKTLGKMMNRGYQLERVLDFLLADERQKEVLKLLRLLRERSQRGYRDYSELFSVVSDYFDEEFFSLLIAGQKTGTVGQNLIDYAEGKEKMLAQKQHLMKTLSSKMVLLGVVSVAFLVIVVFVVPQFQGLFGEKLALPLGMKVMVIFSDVLAHYGLLVVMGSVFLILGLLGLFRFHEGARRLMEKSLYSLPLLGETLRMMETRNFLYLLGSLLSKGVSLMEAIRIVIDQTQSLGFHSVYEAIELELKKGKKLDQIVPGQVPQGYLLESVGQALNLGSRGGNLGEMLLEAYVTYDVVLQGRLSQGIKVIGVVISLVSYVVIIFMIGSLAMTLLRIMEDPTAIA